MKRSEEEREERHGTNSILLLFFHTQLYELVGYFSVMKASEGRGASGDQHTPVHYKISFMNFIFFLSLFSSLFLNYPLGTLNKLNLM